MPEEILPGLYRICLPYLVTPRRTSFVHVYLIRDRTVALVDAGHLKRSCLDPLVEALSRLGLRPQDVEVVIYTHAHIDHMGGGVFLQEVAAPQHWAFRDCVPRVADYGSYAAGFNRAYQRSVHRPLGDSPQRGALLRLMDDFWQPARGHIPIGRPLQEGDRLRLGSWSLEVLHTPGHSPWDICLYEPRRGVLFTGDFLLERITTLTGRVEGMGSSLRAYMSSLRRVRGLRARLVLPGHGSAFGDLAGTVSYLEGLVRMREATLLGMLRERPRGFWEMLEALFSDRSDALALVREVGILLTHLEKLEEEGVVVREEVGERVRWRLSP